MDTKKLILFTILVGLFISSLGCGINSEIGLNSNDDLGSQDEGAKKTYSYDEELGIDLDPFHFQKVVINIGTLYQDQRFRELNPNIQIYGDYLAHINNIESEIFLYEDLELGLLVRNSCINNNSGWRSQLIKQVNLSSRVNMELQLYKIRTQQVTSIQQLEADVSQDNCVVGVSEVQEYEFMGFYEDDPEFNSQDHLRSIFADEAYGLFANSTLGNTEDVVLAVVDSGVDYNHPDLSGVMWTDSNGNHGYDFMEEDDSPMDTLDVGHGTHVAGLAAAHTNNGVNVSGVAGLHTKVMAVRVGDSRGVLYAVNGVNWAVEHGAEIINLSLGGRGQNAQMASALRNAVQNGVTVLVAAGNDGQQLSASNFQSPAGYGKDIEGVITVGSLDSTTGRKSSFSNYSTTYVELGAPGNESSSRGVLSTFPQNQTKRMRGTSMATPVVAGAAALVISSLKSNKIDYTPALVEKILLSGSDKVSFLESQIKDGNSLNLLGVSRVIQQMIIINDGGF